MVLRKKNKKGGKKSSVKQATNPKNTPDNQVGGV